MVNKSQLIQTLEYQLQGFPTMESLGITSTSGTLFYLRDIHVLDHTDEDESYSITLYFNQHNRLTHDSEIYNLVEDLLRDTPYYDFLEVTNTMQRQLMNTLWGDLGGFRQINVPSSYKDSRATRYILLRYNEIASLTTGDSDHGFYLQLNVLGGL